MIEWEGGTVGDGDGTAALESRQGRYNYLPLTKTHRKEETRDLQTATTLTVEFIDCIFKVRCAENFLKTFRATSVA